MITRARKMPLAVARDPAALRLLRARSFALRSQRRTALPGGPCRLFAALEIARARQKPQTAQN
jgi:hypothetical protein